MVSIRPGQFTRTYLGVVVILSDRPFWLNDLSRGSVLFDLTWTWMTPSLTRRTTWMSLSGTVRCGAAGRTAGPGPAICSLYQLNLRTLPWNLVTFQRQTA
jgi:hypothetical protein